MQYEATQIADGVRQADEPVVEIAEDGRQHRKDGEGDSRLRFETFERPGNGALPVEDNDRVIFFSAGQAVRNRFHVLYKPRAATSITSPAPSSPIAGKRF